MALSMGLLAQLPGNFKRFAKLKFPVMYRHHVYAYGDLVREVGGGYECRFFSWLGIDLRGASVYPYSVMSDLIKANDYFYFSGYSVSLMPKYYFAPGKRFYVGLNLTYLSISYSKEWAEPQEGYEYEIYESFGKSQLRDRSLTGLAIGPAIGRQFVYKGICVEPFVSLGSFHGRSSIHVYNPHYAYEVPDYHGRAVDLSGTIGLKIGFCVSTNNKPVYDELARNVNASFDKLDLKVWDLYQNYQISTAAMNTYVSLKRKQNKKLVRMHGCSVKDTLKINDRIKKFETKINHYIDSRTFVKGAYLDTVVTKDNRVIIRRRRGDIYEQRKSSGRAEERFDMFRRPEYKYEEETGGGRVQRN